MIKSYLAHSQVFNSLPLDYILHYINTYVMTTNVKYENKIICTEYTYYDTYLKKAKYTVYESRSTSTLLENDRCEVMWKQDIFTCIGEYHYYIAVNSVWYDEETISSRQTISVQNTSIL